MCGCIVCVDGDGVQDERTYDVEKIVSSTKTGGERHYIVKWKGYASSENTIEPEEHLICNKMLLAFWKAKKNKTELARVTQLQEAALAEKARDTTRRVHALSASAEVHIGATPATKPTSVSPSERPAVSSCRAAYDCAHAALPRAACLVLDTETSGFAGCVLDIGWIIADDAGIELASYSRLWRLPVGERIDSRAFRAHHISAATLSTDGVDPRTEIAELFALLTAALAFGVCIVAHNASFDVARLNHTAFKHKLKLAPLSSAVMLCTMHNATKHCSLRKRGSKSLKPPRNEELYEHFFKRKPSGPLHRALPDCRVTLACFVQGRKLKWW